MSQIPPQQIQPSTGVQASNSSQQQQQQQQQQPTVIKPTPQIINAPPLFPVYDSTFPYVSTKIPSYPMMISQQGERYYQDMDDNAVLSLNPTQKRSAPVNTPLYPRSNSISPVYLLSYPDYQPKTDYQVAKSTTLRRTLRARGLSSFDKQLPSILDDCPTNLFYNDVDNTKGYFDGISPLSHALIDTENTNRLAALVQREIDLFGPQSTRTTTEQQLSNESNKDLEPVQIYLQRIDSNWSQTALQTKTNRFEDDSISKSNSLPLLSWYGPIQSHPTLNAYYSNDTFESVSDRIKSGSINNLNHPTAQETFIKSSFGHALRDVHDAAYHWEQIANNNPLLYDDNNNNNNKNGMNDDCNENIDDTSSLRQLILQISQVIYDDLYFNVSYSTISIDDDDDDNDENTNTKNSTTTTTPPTTTNSNQDDTIPIVPIVSGKIEPIRTEDKGTLFYLRSLFVPPADILEPNNNTNNNNNSTTDLDSIDEKNEQDDINKNNTSDIDGKQTTIINSNKFTLPTLDEICVIVTSLILAHRRNQHLEMKNQYNNNHPTNDNTTSTIPDEVEKTLKKGKKQQVIDTTQEQQQQRQSQQLSHNDEIHLNTDDDYILPPLSTMVSQTYSIPKPHPKLTNTNTRSTTHVTSKALNTVTNTYLNESTLDLSLNEPIARNRDRLYQYEDDCYNHFIPNEYKTIKNNSNPYPLSILTGTKNPNNHLRQNNNNDDSLGLSYQQPLSAYVASHGADQHPWSKFHTHTDMLMYNDDEYQQLLIDTQWTQQQTDRLMFLCFIYNCNFQVVRDRFCAQERLDNIKTSLSSVIETIDDGSSNNNNNKNTSTTTQSTSSSSTTTTMSDSTTITLPSSTTNTKSIADIPLQKHTVSLYKDNIVDFPISNEILDLLRDIKGDDEYIPGNKSIHVHALPDLLKVPQQKQSDLPSPIPSSRPLPSQSTATTHFQPIKTKHILSITTEPIIPAPLYPTYLTPYHENPINAEFFNANNAPDVSKTTQDRIDYQNKYNTKLIDFTTSTNTENTITPAFTGPLLNNTGGQLPNGTPYEIMLSTPSMALLAVSSYISQHQQDSQVLPYPQFGHGKADNIYRQFNLKRLLSPNVSLAHYSISHPTPLYTEPNPSPSQSPQSEQQQPLPLVKQDNLQHLTVEEHRHAPVIPYFAPLGLGIGSYLRTDRKIISSAHKTLEQLQSRFFTIQAILLRHRLRAEIGGVTDFVSLPLVQLQNELIVYNADYDTYRRFELSKLYARNSYLMALVSRAALDLVVMTKVWDTAKEKLLSYIQRTKDQRMMSGMMQPGSGMTQQGHHYNTGQSASGFHQQGRPPQQPHQQGGGMQSGAQIRNGLPPQAPVSNNMHQQKMLPVSGNVPQPVRGPQGGMGPKGAAAHKMLGPYHSPWGQPSTLFCYLTFPVPTSAPQHWTQQLQTKYHGFLTKQLPPQYQQLIESICNRLAETSDVDSSFSYLIAQRDPTVDANAVAEFRTSVSLPQPPPPKNIKKDDQSNIPPTPPLVHGVTRRTLIDYKTFNIFYGFERDITPGYTHTPLIRPPPQQPPNPHAPPQVTAPKNQKIQQQSSLPQTISQKIDALEVLELDKITCLLTTTSLVRHIDTKLITNEQYIFSGKPTNLEKSFQSLERLFQEFPNKKPTSSTSAQVRNTPNLLTLQPAHHFFQPLMNSQMNQSYDNLLAEIRQYDVYHEQYKASLSRYLSNIIKVKLQAVPLPPGMFSLILTPPPAPVSIIANENMEYLEAHIKHQLTTLISKLADRRTQRYQQQQQQKIQQQQQQQQHQQAIPQQQMHGGQPH